MNGNSKERVGHPKQKPVEITDRFVKVLSYLNSFVLDFFGESGTTERVCIKEGRHCLMCDSSDTSIEYFSRHLKLINSLEEKVTYKSVDTVKDFLKK